MNSHYNRLILYIILFFYSTIQALNDNSSGPKVSEISNDAPDIHRRLAWSTVYSIGNIDELKRQLQVSSGVYNHTKGPAAPAIYGGKNNVTLIRTNNLQGYDFSKTVILVVASFGYMNHLQNFLCHISRLQLKVLVVSLDKQTHQNVQLYTNYSSYYFDVKDKQTIGRDSASWRSEAFNVITWRKKMIVMEVMKLGYDVLFTDPDVAIIRDPIPHMIWKNVDYAHSFNAPCDKPQDWKFFFDNYEVEGNSGFYFVKSNSRTIKAWVDAYNQGPNYADLDDQTVFWKVLRASKDPPNHPLREPCRDIADSESKILFNTTVHDRRNLVSCSLDVCMFSSGMARPERYSVLQHELKVSERKAHSVHANWIIGNVQKMQALQASGLWIFERIGDSRRCKPFVERDTPNPAKFLIKSNRPRPKTRQNHPSLK